MHNGSALKLTNSFDQIKYNEVCVMAPFPNVKRFNLIEVLIISVQAEIFGSFNY